jgi:hypothetical protein
MWNTVYIGRGVRQMFVESTEEFIVERLVPAGAGPILPTSA